MQGFYKWWSVGTKPGRLNSLIFHHCFCTRGQWLSYRDPEAFHSAFSNIWSDHAVSWVIVAHCVSNRNWKLSRLFRSGWSLSFSTWWLDGTCRRVWYILGYAMRSAWRYGLLQWAVGKFSSLEAMEFPTMKPMPEGCFSVVSFQDR